MKENEEIKKLNKSALVYKDRIEKLKNEIFKVIVGQEDIVHKLILALMSDGHVLLEGVPGLAKTKMIETLASAISASFSRIQFTPDLLPADILGTTIYNHKDMIFTTRKGPVFANFILADEINRAPPKVQSALLECMQERQVTISDNTYKLEKPFLVLATQNPLETEGTYRLPEAQVDRFMSKLIISYPNADEEKQILERNTTLYNPKINNALTKKDVLEIQEFIKKVYVDDSVKEYAIRIVEATRHPEWLNLNGLIEYGASPRATIWLIMAAKAQAVTMGRGYVLPEDIKFSAFDILRHRIILSYEAEAEDISVDDIIKKVLDYVEVP